MHLTSISLRLIEADDPERYAQREEEQERRTEA